ncbi:MAG TPA: CDP-glycerol glycerophosphotransferase family protein [Amnibacterium sp.]|nr:CDP-glycerol glycerophosphotransferase family protein [Amnibacterium sp.]
MTAAARARRPRIAQLGFGRDSTDLADLLLVGLAVVGALLALVTRTWPIVVVGAVPSLAADLLRVERVPGLRRLARRILLDRPQRSIVRNGAVVVTIAATPPVEPFADFAALLIAVMAIHVALTFYTSFGLRRLAEERTDLQWRNLDVDGRTEGPGPLPDPVQRVLPLDGLRVLAAVEVLVLAGLVCTAAGVPVVPVALAVLSAVVAAAVALVAARAWSDRGDPVRDTDAAVVAAVAALAPEVVFYFSSPSSGTYALTVWANVIDAMRRPTLVVLREAAHLEGLAAMKAPVVVAPTVATLEAVTPPSVRVVLYPTNVVRNNEMVRIPGPMHAFIGHGDSDKVGSFSPLNRMYDEIWVAGRAAIDRYAAVDEGIDLTVLRAVGRPQLAEIRRAVPPTAEGQRLVVLYAPTWEGFFDEADYSSISRMGEGIVRGVLESGAVLRFKPHPLTGHRLPSAAKAREAIEERLRRAGEGSGLVPNSPDALYTAFNEADVLISDISSVITDFLASRKPYLVTNPRDLPDAEFRALFPSAGAAELLGTDLADLPAALADAAGADARRAAREALAEYLLGAESDPLEAFLEEVDRFVERAGARMRSAHVPDGVQL